MTDRNEEQRRQIMLPDWASHLVLFLRHRVQLVTGLFNFRFFSVALVGPARGDSVSCSSITLDAMRTYTSIL
jgi:hypothetical protein